MFYKASSSGIGLVQPRVLLFITSRSIFRDTFHFSKSTGYNDVEIEALLHSSIRNDTRLFDDAAYTDDEVCVRDCPATP